MKNSTKQKIITSLRKIDFAHFYDKAISYRIRNYKYKENELVEAALPIKIDWPVAIDKPKIAVVLDKNDKFPYWEKYLRFLVINEFPHSTVNPNLSTFLDDILGYDIVIWRVSSDIYELNKARDIIYFIEKILRKTVYPSYEELWFYENKINQYYLYQNAKISYIPTFVSYCHEEVKEYLDKIEYPIISKMNTASGSMGVKLLKNKKNAFSFINRVFNGGVKTNYPGVMQKDYVLFQKFIDTATYDLRIIVIDDYYFGYYRYPQKNDYKASGSGIVEKKGIPQPILLLAKNIKERLPKTTLLAIDFLYDKNNNEHLVIESSIFIKIETCEQLVVDSTPGRYFYNKKTENFVFEPGRYWLQEIVLKSLMIDYLKSRNQ